MLGPGIDLPRTGDLLLRILHHLVPLCQPAGRARNGKQHGKHFRLEAHGLVDDSGIEIHVGIQLASNKVIVLQRDAFQLQCDVQPVVAAGYLEYLVGNRLMMRARGS